MFTMYWTSRVFSRASNVVLSIWIRSVIIISYPTTMMPIIVITMRCSIPMLKTYQMVVCLKSQNQRSEWINPVAPKKNTWKIIAYLYFFPFLFENHLMHSPFHFFLVLDMGLAVDSDRCTHHDHTYVNQETLI